MRLVCPYVPAGLRDETIDALEALDRPLEMIDVSASDESYARLIARLWHDGEDFLLIEHDMIPTKDAVEHMECCPRWWCANAYRVNHQVGDVIMGLGFTRFRAELCEVMADAPARAPRWSGRYPRRHWIGVDARLTRVLGEAGMAPHRHLPDVGHLHLV